MRSIVLSGFLFLFFLSCNDNDNNPASTGPENDLDAARNFISHALKGDFTQARRYMLPDSTNEQFISAIERIRLSQEDREGLRNASIIVHEVSQPSDSVTIVVYSNSYKKDQDTLKVVRTGETWLVDLKYLFRHGSEDAQKQPGKIDTIK